MPLPLIIPIIAGAAALFGAGKTVGAIMDKNEADSTNRVAKWKVDDSKKAVNAYRTQCDLYLKKLGSTKVEIIANTVTHFVDSFKKLKNVDFRVAELDENLNIDKDKMAELKELEGLAESVASGLASGALSGALAGFGAYSAVGALATASTGTAIGSLSGAAAANATLAWLGGGSLAAGGLGVAGGMAVLGGLVAAPALAVMGCIMGSKAKEALEVADSNYAEASKIEEELKTVCDLCYGISSKAFLFRNALIKLNTKAEPMVNEIDLIIDCCGTDFSKFTPNVQQKIAATAATVSAIKAICNTPILDDQGKIIDNSEKVIDKYKDSLDPIPSSLVKPGDGVLWNSDSSLNPILSEIESETTTQV